MAHPYHHSLSSVKTWGGEITDYQPIHDWFDQSKQIIADFRHRALRHHAEGVFMAETVFGSTIALSTGRIIPVRLIGEQHVREDLGFIPSFADWVRAIRPQRWMGRALRLSERLDFPVSPERQPLASGAATVLNCPARNDYFGHLPQDAPPRQPPNHLERNDHES